MVDGLGGVYIGGESGAVGSLVGRYDTLAAASTAAAEGPGRYIMRVHDSRVYMPDGTWD